MFLNPVYHILYAKIEYFKYSPFVNFPRMIRPQRFLRFIKMTEEVFANDNREEELGLVANLTYRSQPLLRVEHRKAYLPGTFILNYNVFFSSRNQILDNMPHATSYMMKLRGKKVRSFKQALMDSKQYYGSIFEGQAEVANTRVTTGSYSWVDIDGFRPDLVTLLTKGERVGMIKFTNDTTGSLLLSAYPTFDSGIEEDLPIANSYVRIDGFDSNVAEELSDLMIETSYIEIKPEHKDKLKFAVKKALSVYHPQIV